MRVFNHKKQWCQVRTQLSSVFYSDTTAIDNCGITYFWCVSSRAPNLWFVYFPNWHFPLHLPPTQYTVSNAWYLAIISHPTSLQEILEQKSIFTFTLRTIYPSTRSMEQHNKSPYRKNDHIRPSINKWFRPATNSDATLTALIQHDEGNF